ncbi:hypothetical protein BKA66DRAFT_431585 [Pyrenochaeta sp. MPI-SDFR-AT-0127]|nr:hypothetical protein BKA66DRAFT_431585 [Pyrenochaeta sp. MPI-SDFR-AT-0127]
MGNDSRLGRVRKVRCDSSRPVCKRCVSTGRVCEGYGVWGGGNNPFGHQPPMTREPLPINSGLLTSDEQKYAEWFVCNTAGRMSGAFASTFWHRLVLQANFHEPAVLHATVALAAAEKRSFLILDPFPKAEPKLDDEERFILRQYNKAIKHARPLFSRRDKASVRVLLMDCMIFTCLEFIRGRHKAGYTHLSNGLRLLDQIATTEGSYEDSWLHEVFFTLNTHSALFQHSIPCRYVQHLPPPLTSPPPIRYESIPQARQHLDRLLSATHHLTAQHLRHEDNRPLTDLLLCQRRICEELHAWKASYNILKARVFGAVAQVARRDNKALRFLSVHHTLANILSETCLRGEDESVFDRHTHLFGTLVRQVFGLIEFKVSDTPAYIGCDRYHFSADMGFIPPLFFTALKCRALRVRMRAVKLLRILGHQEGIWDATLVAAVAEEVIRYEDERAQNGLLMDAYDFPLAGDPPQIVIPERLRVQQINITLPDEPMGNVMVVYGRRQDDGSWGSFRREFVCVSGKGYVAVQASGTRR